jgi:hypothetical protein
MELDVLDFMKLLEPITYPLGQVIINYKVADPSKVHLFYGHILPKACRMA